MSNRLSASLVLVSTCAASFSANAVLVKVKADKTPEDKALNSLSSLQKKAVQISQTNRSMQTGSGMGSFSKSPRLYPGSSDTSLCYTNGVDTTKGTDLVGISCDAGKQPNYAATEEDKKCTICPQGYYSKGSVYNTANGLEDACHPCPKGSVSKRTDGGALATNGADTCAYCGPNQIVENNTCQNCPTYPYIEASNIYITKGEAINIPTYPNIAKNECIACTMKLNYKRIDETQNPLIEEFVPSAYSGMNLNGGYCQTCVNGTVFKFDRSIVTIDGVKIRKNEFISGTGRDISRLSCYDCLAEETSTYDTTEGVKCHKFVCSEGKYKPSATGDGITSWGYCASCNGKSASGWALSSYYKNNTSAEFESGSRYSYCPQAELNDAGTAVTCISTSAPSSGVRDDWSGLNQNGCVKCSNLGSNYAPSGGDDGKGYYSQTQTIGILKGMDGIKLSEIDRSYCVNCPDWAPPEEDSTTGIRKCTRDTDYDDYGTCSNSSRTWRLMLSRTTLDTWRNPGASSDTTDYEIYATIRNKNCGNGLTPLYRIESCTGGVKGGYISDPTKLADTAWIGSNVIICGNAQVTGDNTYFNPASKNIIKNSTIGGSIGGATKASPAGDIRVCQIKSDGTEVKTASTEAFTSEILAGQDECAVSIGDADITAASGASVVINGIDKDRINLSAYTTSQRDQINLNDPTMKLVSGKITATLGSILIQNKNYASGTTVLTEAGKVIVALEGEGKIETNSSSSAKWEITGAYKRYNGDWVAKTTDISGTAKLISTSSVSAVRGGTISGNPTITNIRVGHPHTSNYFEALSGFTITGGSVNSSLMGGNTKIYGGTISGGSWGSSSGTTVYGGTITGGQYNGGTISGSPVIKNIYISSGSISGGTLTNNGAWAGIHIAGAHIEGGTFTVPSSEAAYYSIKAIGGTIKGGTFTSGTVAQSIYVTSGTINGGTFTAKNRTNSIYVSGGTINNGSFVAESNISVSGSATINNGTIQGGSFSENAVIDITQSGETCTPIQVEAVKNCLDGWFFDESEQKCKITLRTNYTLLCPDGYELDGGDVKVCEKRLTTPITKTCSSGYFLSGNDCVKITNYVASSSGCSSGVTETCTTLPSGTCCPNCDDIITCPLGGTFNNDYVCGSGTYDLGTCTKIEYQTPTYSCPSGYLNIGNNYCEKTEQTDPIYSCPSPYTYIESENMCVSNQEQDPTLECPTDYVLNGEMCDGEICTPSSGYIKNGNFSGNVSVSGSPTILNGDFSGGIISGKPIIENIVMTGGKIEGNDIQITSLNLIKGNIKDYVRISTGTVNTTGDVYGHIQGSDTYRDSCSTSCVETVSKTCSDCYECGSNMSGEWVSETCCIDYDCSYSVTKTVSDSCSRSCSGGAIIYSNLSGQTISGSSDWCTGPLGNICYSTCSPSHCTASCSC
ncbi:MAG: hypothetical protein PHI50_00240 [Alphaproteobacteria bacterium]|nr:hypothetical protein [Alphaproteobacteria bacterium]